MDSVETLVTDRIIELRLAWDDFIQGFTVAGDQPLIQSYFDASRSTRDAGSCPEGTALDAVLDPSVMIQVEEWIYAQAVQKLPPFDEGESWVRGMTGVGAQAFGFGISAQWEPGAEGRNFYEVLFDRSEEPNPIARDSLVFEVDYLGNGPASGRPLMTIDFNPELSRAAGQPVRNLERGGEYANDCIVAKIERALTEQGYTFHYPPHDPTPRPFPEFQGGSGFSVDRCPKRLAAKVNGVVQYTFIIFVDCVRP